MRKGKYLPPQPTATRNRYRRGPRRYLRATLTHGVMPLTPWPTASGR
jgi:hypothetical protein